MLNFKLISSTKALDAIPVSKYVSTKTGLTVIIAKVAGPVVEGYFSLATEALDDDGVPHTLEHLVFLGSERYPYKGVLDLLANRCIADGTNAWTATDHTCYTISTAGDEGMLTLLPIYLDHILRPTLTDEGFITEVHHIDGDGDDAGVVYCEMQGMENTAYRCERKLMRAMYPNSGYSSETGGVLKNLRTSTNNIKIKSFHKKFYRPENVTIVLAGQIEAEDVFKSLAIIENDIIDKRQKEPLEEWVKPWQTIPSPPIYGEFEEHWPADTEDCGQVTFGWRGPLLTDANSWEELKGLDILLQYLCDTAVAPLQRCLVEREDAIAGDISFDAEKFLATCFKITLATVPVDKLQSARDEAKSCLKSIINGNETIDIDRMRRLIRKKLRTCISVLETDPHQTVVEDCIFDALYSRNEEDFVRYLNPQKVFQYLLDRDVDYWLSLARKYLTDDVIIIMGSPSIELQDKMTQEEQKRIEDQRAMLGESGLARKSKELEDAIEFNKMPIPDGTLASVKVPSGDNFKFISLDTWNTETHSKNPCPHLDLADIPMYTRAHSLDTNFVYITLVFDTASVDDKTRQWLLLLDDSFGECPVRRDGKLISHEDIISTTENLTVNCSSNIGISGKANTFVSHFGNFFIVKAMCEPSDYNAVVDHLYEMIYAAEFTKERLLVFAQRMINLFSKVRREGNRMVHDTLRDKIYTKKSNIHWCSVVRQHKFLKNLIEQLNASEESANKVIQDAKETFRNISETVWLDLSTNFDKFRLSAEPWKKFARDNDVTPSVPRLYHDASLTVETNGGFVVGVGGLESAFLAQFSPGPLAYKLDVLAPLEVALNYFTQLEGPMWRLIRGCGLSYGYGVGSSPSEGRLIFTLYRSANPVQAYNKAKTIIEEYLAGRSFDEDLFASAKSTTLYNAVQSITNPAAVVASSLTNYVKRLGDSYDKELILAIASVTRETAHEAAERWLPSLFDNQKTTTSLVCNPAKISDMQSAFDKINIKLEPFESLEASHFGK